MINSFQVESWSADSSRAVSALQGHAVQRVGAQERKPYRLIAFTG